MSVNGRTFSLKIALDYDLTYDQDPLMWDEIIETFRKAGHEVVLLTYRDERYDMTSLLTHLIEDIRIPVYFTRGVAKKWWSEQFGPGKIDVWIDDKPEAILGNSTLSLEGLKEWREKNVGDTITV